MEDSTYLAVKNLKSWDRMVLFYEGHQTSDYHEFTTPLLELVRRIAGTRRAERFRAGSSLWHLMISTAEKHGLKEHEPFVGVTTDQDLRYRIEYYSAFTRRVDAAATCDTADVLGELDRFLARLWAETRGRDEAPGLSEE
jgi:hypothetical protein